MQIYNRVLSSNEVVALYREDTHGNGLSNVTEVKTYGTNPNLADSDSDGMPDGWEVAHGFDPSNSSDGSADADNDGLSNADEFIYGADPFKPDSDGDGLRDGTEVATHGTDPTKSDTDDDGLSDSEEITLGTDPLSAAPDPTLTALAGFNYAQVNLLRGLAGLSPTAWNHGAPLATQITTIRSSLTDLFPHCLDLTVNIDGVLASSSSVTTWTLSTVLQAVGAGPNNWLSGATSTNQVAELTAVLGQLTYLVAAETAQAGHPDAPHALTGAPNRVETFTTSFAYPSNWVPSWEPKTYFHATNNTGYGSSIADDFVKFNGTVIAGAAGWCSPDTNCPSLPTAFTYAVTSLWLTNSTNTIELWDGGCCGGANNTAYLAPFQIVHVLQPPVVTIEFVADQPCSGFDDWTGFHGALSDRDLRVWLPVPQSGSNTLKATISPLTQLSNVLSFDTEPPAIGTVSPAFATAATQVLTVTGTAAGNVIQPTLIRAKIGDTVVASFYADVLPVKTGVTVALYHVTNTGDNGTTPAVVPTAAQLQIKLNDVFGKQANVFFTVWPEVVTDFPYDTDPPNGKLDTLEEPCGDRRLPSDEWQNLWTGLATNAVLRVYHVKSLANACSEIQPAGWTPIDRDGRGLPVSFSQDDHPGSPAYIDTHEIGHALGSLADLKTAATGDTTRLMWGAAQAGDPCKLIRAEWRQFNRRARGE